ncbi:unnamed protein product [Symbiodinium natans]|uniref:Uncharacterized protein n=1 Tax=Symbiodinium natans TaxID=878477 RepID=A0A812MWL9_9DINO|nr:unnamed protein product [Symbiodinium natans]
MSHPQTLNLYTVMAQVQLRAPTSDCILPISSKRRKTTMASGKDPEVASGVLKDMEGVRATRSRLEANYLLTTPHVHGLLSALGAEDHPSSNGFIAGSGRHAQVDGT